MYLAEWHSTTVAVKVLFNKEAAAQLSSDTVASALALPAHMQAKLEAEAGLLAALRHPWCAHTGRGGGERETEHCAAVHAFAAADCGKPAASRTSTSRLPPPLPAHAASCRSTPCAASRPA